MENDNFWLRQCVLVAETTGEPLIISDLRMTFEVRKTDVQTPNLCTLRIYNPSQATITALQTKLLPIKLYAGYKGNVALIFDGNIVEATQKWEKTDIILELFAGDGDRAYVYGTVNKTLASGCTYSDQVNVCLESFAEKGVGRGYIPELGGPNSPRGVVMYGQANSYMRDLARDTNTTWSIQDGKVQMIPLNGHLPDEPVVLTSESGLLSVEEKEIHYIILHCLLNPHLRIGGRLKIDNAGVIGKNNGDYLTIRPPSTEHDGIYRIISITHKGDTHGTSSAWISEVNSLIIDSTSGKPIDVVAGVIPARPVSFEALSSLSAALNALAPKFPNFPQSGNSPSAGREHELLKIKESSSSTRLLIVRDLVQNYYTFKTRDMWDENPPELSEATNVNYNSITVEGSGVATPAAIPATIPATIPADVKKTTKIIWHYIIDKSGIIYEGQDISRRAQDNPKNPSSPNSQTSPSNPNSPADTSSTTIAVLCLGPFNGFENNDSTPAKQIHTTSSLSSYQTASNKQRQSLIALGEALAKRFKLLK